MLLHKRRVQGEFFGFGYQNPYMFSIPEPMRAPIDRQHYITNLTLVPQKVEEIKISQQQQQLQTESNGNGQSGSGAQEVVTAAQAVYKTLQQLSKFYGSETATKMKNFYGQKINPHPNFRPGFAGEKHMIIDGTMGNFLGPGTQIEQRVKRGDPPIDGPRGVDAAARIHDIEYLNAKTMKDVRKADHKFIKNVEKSTASRTMKTLAKGAIKTKMALEDIGMLDKNYFAQIDIVDTKDAGFVGQGMKKSVKSIAQKVQNQIENKTNKLSKVRLDGKYPDSYIRNKLLKQYKKGSRKLKNKIRK